MKNSEIIFCIAGLVICIVFFFLKSVVLIFQAQTLIDIWVIFNIGLLYFSSYLLAKYIQRYGEEDEN